MIKLFFLLTHYINFETNFFYLLIEWFISNSLILSNFYILFLFLRKIYLFFWIYPLSVRILLDNSWFINLCDNMIFCLVFFHLNETFTIKFTIAIRKIQNMPNLLLTTVHNCMLIQSMHGFDCIGEAFFIN